MPSNYWADWDPNSAAPHIIRRDTRLYWRPQGQGTVGKSVGAFVGENPGSAESIHGLQYAGYSSIWQRNQPGDPTLRLLLEIWCHAVAQQWLTEPESTNSQGYWNDVGGLAVKQQAGVGQSNGFVSGAAA